MQQPDQALTLEGIVTKIIFFNEENAYLVLELETEGERVVVVGYAANLCAGESVRVTGEYVTHPAYGRQFSACSIESVPPTSQAGILAYLESGIVKGIGKTLAARMVERFGEQTLFILDKDPSRLTEVKGITPSRARQLNQRYRQLQGVRQVLAELQAFHLPPYVAVKLYKRYGVAASDALRADPYLLCGEDYGMEFALVDLSLIHI